MRHQTYLDVSQSEDVNTFERRLLAFANEMDFGLITAALVVDRPGQKSAFYALGNTPEAFKEASANTVDSHRDPVLKRLKRMSVPFLYDQALYVTEGAGDLWEQQATFGYRTGISVALHLPEHKHFLLGVDRQKTLPKSDSKVTRMLADLQLLAVHAQHAAVRLLAASSPAAKTVNLSPREIEVLRWTMAGKSAWEVGQILKISEGTVNFHVRSTLRKLDVVDKHQAVLKALGLGLL